MVSPLVEKIGTWKKKKKKTTEKYSKRIFTALHQENSGLG